MIAIITGRGMAIKREYLFKLGAMAKAIYTKMPINFNGYKSHITPKQINVAENKYKAQITSTFNTPAIYLA